MSARLSRRYDEPFMPYDRGRPWWWWVAYAALMAGGFWVCWRTFAGWPVGQSLLQRLAG